jgi:uncharacterized protein (TIGR00730 family)
MSRRELRRVCVFAGSSPGALAAYVECAGALGRELATQGISLVYGGGRVGVMGKLADAALAQGGEVIGVIPQALVAREVAHSRLTELRVVTSMHERKATMAELSDAFVALPGGLGTLEELFEVLTWSQLGLHAKPCALLNAAGYYDHLLTFLEHATSERFVRAEHRHMLVVGTSPGEIIEHLRAYVPPRVDKWLDRASS